MRKTKTQTPEQTTEKPKRTPFAMTEQEFARTMIELTRDDKYRALKSQWLNIQSQIIEQGKAKPSELQWAVLDGFHRAVQEAEIWAAKWKSEIDGKREPKSPVEGME